MTGTMSYTVTRVCVRTNEKFVVTVKDQPLQAVIRPALPVAGLWQEQPQQQEEESRKGSKNNKNKNSKKKTKQSSPRNNKTTLDELDMTELQRLIDRQQQDNDWDMDDLVLEDEGIYPASAAAGVGAIDVGELVAQLFWLSLDPYPKKPGTDAVQVSISSDSI